jgi:hypothetical protein
MALRSLYNLSNNARPVASSITHSEPRTPGFELSTPCSCDNAGAGAHNSEFNFRLPRNGYVLAF